MSDLGVEFDLGPLFLSIKAGIDEQNGLMRRHLRELAAARMATTPTDIDISGTATVNANGFAIVTLNPASPDQGHVWLLRNLIVARADAPLTSSLAGTFWVFVNGSPASTVTSILSPVGLKTAFSTLPATSTWSNRQIQVKAEEYLYGVITGGTNAQQVWCQARVEDYQESAARQVYDL